MYHVNNDGKVGKCTATTKPCPFSSDRHFEDKSQAENFSQKLHQEEFGLLGSDEVIKRHSRVLRRAATYLTYDEIAKCGVKPNIVNIDSTIEIDDNNNKVINLHSVDIKLNNESFELDYGDDPVTMNIMKDANLSEQELIEKNGGGRIHGFIMNNARNSKGVALEDYVVQIDKTERGASVREIDRFLSKYNLSPGLSNINFSSEYNEQIELTGKGGGYERATSDVFGKDLEKLKNLANKANMKIPEYIWFD